jgi:hypothetical protein
MADYIGQALPAKIIHPRVPITLFEIAMEELGDALQWVRIAALNNLDDPWISSIIQGGLKIPEPGPNQGGVPNP